MKKFLLTLLALALAALPVLAEVTPDAVTGASVADFYGDFALTGDDLMNAINSYNGFFATATVNPDGTPNIGFYIFSCVKEGEDYYLQYGLAENQTKANMDAGSAVMAMYAPVPDSEAEGAMPYATAGARMALERVTDEALLETLKANAPQKSDLFYKVTSVRSLG